ncbi:hypothetical protein [Caballeronia sp. ATUFL_M2_KS44]|uniref:hypothetical protein n=1 Tax=Caballeronia sp. ATUFL_M2_KS44 TaxID=2921767 RepID=UPI002027E0A5|nr:hypothetical protein [Caballeronia sp. ATUFL_M2_KS44]
MASGFGKWQPSYNTLDVPLNIGWQCTLAPRLQCGTEFWFLKEDARKAIEDDRIAFDRCFRPNLDFRTISGGRALLTIQRFLQTFLRVVHWDQPTSNEEVERIFRKAVRDEVLIPVVNREWRLAPRFDVPPDAPQRWPKQAAFLYAPRDPEYIPIRQRGGVAGGGSPGGGGLGGVVANFGGAGSLMDSVGGSTGGSGGFDWLGAAESVAGAVLGGYESEADDASSLAMSFTGDNTPLSDASPFEFESETGDESFDIAGMSQMNGDPFSWIESGPDEKQQWRMFGGDGGAAVDIDFDSHHGQPNPHAHNWDGLKRDQGWPVSIFPR